MTVTRKGKCTSGLGISNYGTGELITVYWSNPTVADISSIGFELLDGESYSDFVIVRKDEAPEISPSVVLLISVDGGTASTVYLSDPDLLSARWGFNCMKDFYHNEQEYETIAKYELKVNTVLFEFIDLVNIKTSRVVHEENVSIGTSSLPAIDDIYIFQQEKYGQSFGSPDRDILFIPYLNVRE